MDAAISQTSKAGSSGLGPEIPGIADDLRATPTVDADELVFKLGLWLSGLESFLSIQNNAFAEETYAKAGARDWTREFRLTHATLLLCLSLLHQLVRASGGPNRPGNGNDPYPSPDDLHELSNTLRDAALLNEGILRGAPLKLTEWTAWGGFLSRQLLGIPVFEKIIACAEEAGENALPQGLADLLQKRDVSLADQADLRLVLPHFAKILKWLSVIGQMLERDEPLKPSLLIFARVYEQINEMMSYINNRLQRYGDEEAELFGVLDGAAYAASIELRKVYNHELSGIVNLRTTPSVYAKTETAFALLNDSFQLTLITFAQLIDPTIESHKIFPNLKTKFERSVTLRRKMWELLQDVRSAEKDPDNFPLGDLHEKLAHFRDKTQHYLFYKDKETVERFIEELLVTYNKKDLVPILHRFSAYMETLFGQVNMRVVLANHPFTPEAA